MTQNTAHRRGTAALLAVLLLLVFVGCSPSDHVPNAVTEAGDTGTNETLADGTTAEVTASPDTEGDDTETNDADEIPLDPPFFDENMASVTFTDVSDLIGEEYAVTQDGLVYINAVSPLIEIGGIPHPSENRGEYYRLDAYAKNSFPAAVRQLAANTAGATLRFCVKGDRFVLRVKMRSVSAGMLHFADSGSYGLDVYVGSGTDRRLVTDTEGLLVDTNGFTRTVTLPADCQEVTVDLPLYAGVSKVEIGLTEDDGIAPPTARSYGDILFYGSSITQGASVSRPGLAYSSIVCRMLNANCRNLGFSGSAKGEQVVSDYIASCDMAAFVLDYDWNADSYAWLQDTHYNVYKTVRNAHPDIPIIMMSRPIFTPESTFDQNQRRAVVRATYERALAERDENVYFISGADFFPFDTPDQATADHIHPNDIGHYYMAMAVYDVLKPVLEAALTKGA